VKYLPLFHHFKAIYQFPKQNFFGQNSSECSFKFLFQVYTVSNDTPILLSLWSRQPETFVYNITPYHLKTRDNGTTESIDNKKM
jgi:hypothetical protein